jgi:hypothetical protein
MVIRFMDGSYLPGVERMVPDQHALDCSCKRKPCCRRRVSWIPTAKGTCWELGLGAGGNVWCATLQMSRLGDEMWKVKESDRV